MFFETILTLVAAIVICFSIIVLAHEVKLLIQYNQYLKQIFNQNLQKKYKNS